MAALLTAAAQGLLYKSCYTQGLLYKSCYTQGLLYKSCYTRCMNKAEKSKLMTIICLINPLLLI